MEEKTFTLRSIPGKLHHSWKTVSNLKGCSMRLYALRALRKQLELDMWTLEKKNILKEKLERL